LKIRSSGQEVEGRKALEWLRGGSSSAATIGLEVRAIKQELQRKAASSVSGKEEALLQLPPQRFPRWFELFVPTTPQSH
jgi:hypothetical protein